MPAQPCGQLKPLPQATGWQGMPASIRGAGTILGMGCIIWHTVAGTRKSWEGIVRTMEDGEEGQRTAPTVVLRFQCLLNPLEMPTAPSIPLQVLWGLGGGCHAYSRQKTAPVLITTQ